MHAPEAQKLGGQIGGWGLKRRSYIFPAVSPLRLSSIFFLLNSQEQEPPVNRPVHLQHTHANERCAG
eukprot:scaffold206707_cov23-Tisochrysis_lutea.AAC.1